MATVGHLKGSPKGIGTPIAVVFQGESTQVSLQSSISDSEVFANAGLYAECLQLKVENAKLKAENEGLRAKVVAMQATNPTEQFLEIREIPREQAKEEIKDYFDAHDGKTIYPSDLMDVLQLDYDLVWELCDELEQEGKIKGL